MHMCTNNVWRYGGRIYASSKRGERKKKPQLDGHNREKKGRTYFLTNFVLNLDNSKIGLTQLRSKMLTLSFMVR